MQLTDELTESLTLKFSQLAREKVSKGEQLFSLGLGEPNINPPVEIVDSVYKAAQEGYNKYMNSMGSNQLRENISKKLQNENDIKCTKDDIFITFGAKQALVLTLMAILEPFDEVINFTPCYVSYIPQIKIAEPRSVIHNIDLNRNDFSIDFDRLEEKINDKTKAIIVNSPNNPTGKIITEEEYRKLSDLVAGKDIYIISDEIYEYLNFSNQKHISPGSFPELAEKVITINGFSKSFGITGWRVGYMKVPKKIKSTIYKLMQHINTNVTSFIQKGIENIYDLDRSFIEDYKKQLKNMSEYVCDELDKTSVSVIKPSAGFFCFVDISSSGLSSDAFATKLLDEQNVALNPGIAFGPNWDDYVRISYAGDKKEIEHGIMGIKNFLNK
jgi:aspartate/methionine/tyrosine aminotransferase